MAITQSTQYAAQVAAATSFNSRIDDARTISGPVQYAYIDLVFPADQAALSVVDLIELPPGSIVIPEQSSIIVSNDITSGACTVDIGDVVDVDRYCDGADIAATGTVQFLAPAYPDAFTNRYSVLDTGVTSTTTTLIKLTFATLTATVEVGAIRVILAYKCL